MKTGKAATIQFAKKGGKARPASAKQVPPASHVSTMHHSSQLSQLQTSKDSDQGIHLTQILNYYRSRVEAFERDRVQWYDKLQAIRPKQELVHRVEWELKKR